MARIVDGTRMNLIGDKVRQYRQARNMSQQALSNKLELLGVYVCRGSISRIEEHLRTVTDVELCAIASVLKVDITALLESPLPFAD